MINTDPSYYQYKTNIRFKLIYTTSAAYNYYSRST